MSFSVPAVEQADMRIGALDHLAVHLEHQAQHAMRRRVCGPKLIVKFLSWTSVMSRVS